MTEQEQRVFRAYIAKLTTLLGAGRVDNEALMDRIERLLERLKREESA